MALRHDVDIYAGIDATRHRDNIPGSNSEHPLLQKPNV